ncbi:hydroxymethylbilane synthase [Pelagibacteraceae bacterium]|jgi:hydroxymethylbilane synthase|nr:hydroxymethylbilane synthase [Pelagibacteraceae bacterium]
MFSKEKFIIGSRGSRLSLAQAEHFKDELLLANPNLRAEQIELKVIKTSGDKFKTENLASMGGKGLFVKEIEEELINKNIDCAVHSLKDVPTFGVPSLMLAAFLKRKDERDAFISPVAKSFNQLKPGSTVGTSSVRRIAQLKKLRSDLNIVSMRGNIDSRIEKVKEGIYDSIVLAYAGIKRLGFHNYVSEIFDKDKMLPAAGQGIVAIQCRVDDFNTIKLLDSINDKETEIIVDAERSFLHRVNGACDTPVAANAIINEDNEIFLQAELLSLDGSKVFRAHKTGLMEKAVSIGLDVAEEILDKAGHDFIVSETKLAHTIHKT